MVTSLSCVSVKIVLCLLFLPDRGNPGVQQLLGCFSGVDFSFGWQSSICGLDLARRAGEASWGAAGSGRVWRIIFILFFFRDLGELDPFFVWSSGYELLNCCCSLVAVKVLKVIKCYAKNDPAPLLNDRPKKLQKVRGAFIFSQRPCPRQHRCLPGEVGEGSGW